MLVVIGGIKGGCGKSTIATNLAVLRSNDNRKVLFVDADEQKTSFTWVEQRKCLDIETKWTTIKLSGRGIYQELKKMEPDYDDIIVDVGGTDTTSQRSALVIADRYIVPFKPRSFDIWTIPILRQMIIEISAVNPKLLTFGIITQADHKGNDNIEALKIIAECPEIECLSFFIGNRKSFANASTEGLSVIEMENPDKKACAEIKMLYEYIFKESYAT